MVAPIWTVPGSLGLASFVLAVFPALAAPEPRLAQAPSLPDSVPAETEPLPPPSDLIRPRPQPPDVEVLPDEGVDILPITPAPPSAPRPSEVSPDTSIFFEVQDFTVNGNTVFTEAELVEVLRTVVPLPQEQTTVADLFLAAEALAEHYQDAGYLTTGAIPVVIVGADQQLEIAPNGLVTFQVFEGRVESIEVSGTQRLRPDYVRSRLALATTPPLNETALIDALQLLHNDPLIEQVQAALVAGTELGTNVLQVEVQEAKSFQAGLFLDNQRSPNVGARQHGIQLSEHNLLGLGDRLAVSYHNTEGSDGVGASYTIPLNPKAGTLSLSYSRTSNDIITPELELLGIESTSDYLDLTWRQPLIRSLRQEFAVGITASHRRSRALFGEFFFDEPIGFPVGDGRSQATAVRLFQDWIARGETQAVAVRSQFSIGLDAQEPTATGTRSSNFFSWRGLAQYRRQLGQDTVFSVQGDVQLANRGLIPLEQFSLGGQGSVRGYREDLLLADNGAFVSAEVWLPILRLPEVDGVLQLTPFVDVGTVWNSNDEAIATNDLASVGLGLRWQHDTLSARLDWGLPLISVDGDDDTLQENGLHFSIIFNAF